MTTAKQMRVHTAMGRAVKALGAAEEALGDAVLEIARVEMAELAKRFPRRILSLDSGMGSTSLTISRRHPINALDEWQWSDHGQCNNWPERLEEPMPDLWSAIRLYRDSCRGVDPGFGTIRYRNGICLLGLIPA